ncbi:MAG: trigger factor [Bacteroidetes bacterium]|nr:MAG: trigger factor [Bacteroidota bacterium]
MNITKENIDELNATLKIKLEKEDYEEKVNNVLKDYKKKAKIDGFRPGKVPMGLVKKMYGKTVLAEEINKILSESLTKHIIDEKLNILGEPLPSIKEQAPIDWDNQTEFEFAFDIALSPEFELNLSKRDKVTFYDIEVGDDLIDKTIESHTKFYGTSEKVDVVEDNEILKGDMVQLDKEGKVLEGGITKEDAIISLQVMKDEKIKKSFVGANVSQIITFNIKKAYPNATEISSMLGISKEEAEKLDSDFQFTIKEITKFVSGEVNQELFDKIYGAGNVKSLEEFRAKIKEEIKKDFDEQSNYKLLIDVKDKLVKKTKLALPDEFLKRWLLLSNKELTQEMLDKDYDNFQKDLQWQLIKDKIVKGHEIKVTDEEILEEAKKVTMQQFRQYGMRNLPEEQLENYSKSILEKPEDKRKIADSRLEKNIIEFIKETIKVENKEMTFDEFNKLFAN